MLCDSGWLGQSLRARWSSVFSSATGAFPECRCNALLLNLLACSQSWKAMAGDRVNVSNALKKTVYFA
ncbi:hypothetical protein QUF54_11390 [Candidatus Marithioploca araucensis]|uniref:Uncharacterized protein n=1 Tax=Candidatus Marithioploca araucensis TaxID=70273 RepID=A0ABT7VWK3_9GAMM|nr:hypothetical protein [Candidatus Marithioploca araucensis]